MWTRSYFASTAGNVSSETIEWYINTQKTRIKFMQLSETVKLYPTKYQLELIKTTMTEYKNTINSLVFDATSGKSIANTTTADISANLPSALVF